MGWSNAFHDWLGRPRRAPRFLVETVPVSGYLPGATLHVASHAGYSGYAQAITRVSQTAGALHTGDWACTAGGLVVGLRNSIDLRKNDPRGTLIRMLVDGGRGVPREPVFLGQVQDVRRSADGGWELVARSMLSALVTRFTQTSDEAGLFYDLPESGVELTGNYNPGDTTVEVASTAGAETLSGGLYLIEVTPDSGDPFFLTATGTDVGPIRFKGVSATAILGGTAAAATATAGNSSVRICAYLERNPVDAALVTLTSTGTGGNGSYDVGPASWGYGMPFEHIDQGDCLTTRSIITPSSGSEDWDIYSTTLQDDGATWLQSILGPGGMFIADRQGQLTIRCAPGLNDISYGLHTLTDREIISVNSYSRWDPSQPAEYGAYRTLTASGSAITQLEQLESRPAIRSRWVQMPFIGQNESAWRIALNSRLSRLSTMIPEAFEVTVSGWRLAGLCMGDRLLLQSRLLRLQDLGPAMVLSVQPDWMGGTTKIRAVHTPQLASPWGTS